MLLITRIASSVTCLSAWWVVLLTLSPKLQSPFIPSCLRITFPVSPHGVSHGQGYSCSSTLVSTLMGQHNFCWEWPLQGILPTETLAWELLLIPQHQAWPEISGSLGSGKRVKWIHGKGWLYLHLVQHLSPRPKVALTVLLLHTNFILCLTNYCFFSFCSSLLSTGSQTNPWYMWGDRLSYLLSHSSTCFSFFRLKIKTPYSHICIVNLKLILKSARND